MSTPQDKLFASICAIANSHGALIRHNTEALNPAPNLDSLVLDWLERSHSLHLSVAALYVVDGYDVTIEHDGEPCAGPWHGETLRDAYFKAMMEWEREGSHGWRRP